MAVGPLTTGAPTEDTRVALIDVCVENVRSAPEHLTLWTDETNTNHTDVYGANAKIIRGPVGDALSMDMTRPYVPNVLTEAQMFLARHEGAGYIPENVLAWAEKETSHAEDVYAIEGRDSMNHIMKGNAGIFVSGLHEVTMDRVRIKGVHNDGTTGHRGDVAIGILANASSIIMRNVHIEDVQHQAIDMKHDASIQATAVHIGQTPVPVVKDKTSTIVYEDCGHATLTV